MSAAVLAVFIIDDNPDDRAEVRQLLLRGSPRRYRFTEADSAQQALVCLAQSGELPDCIILDFHLPDRDAIEVLTALRGGEPLTSCPVLVLTGGGGAQHGPELLRAGAQDYLNKAWLNPELLTRAVDHTIERYQLACAAREREAALQKSEERLRLALQASSTGMWTWDVQSDAVSWSPECFALLGLPEGGSAGSGADFFRRIHADDLPRVQAAVQTALAEHALYECEFRVARPDGELLWVANRGRGTYDAAGRPLSLTGTVTDISRRKRAEEALLESDRRKDEFLATLAHELRNPLAPLRMGLIALGRAAPGQDTSRLRAMMERQLGSLVRLIDELLDVSRIISGKVELVRERLALQRVFEAALETSRPLIEAAGHTLVVRLPEAPLWLDGDLTRLSQVLSNLLNNAAKYTPAGGRIELGAEARGGELFIRVIDNGCGIPQDMLTRVFEIFTQVDRTLARAQGGLGVGLSLVRGLVALHGGQVTAHSEGPGRGSTFVLRLPLAAAPIAAEVASASPGPSRGPSRRVLVVDDNVDAADSLAEVLQLSGHTVRAVYSGSAALAAARELRPELIFLDIGLPDLSGHQVARQLRAEPQLAGVVLVALTGWGTAEDRQLSQAAGFDHHLTKPAEPAAVDELLGRLPL